MAADSGMSDLARIEGITEDPVDLFRGWHEEGRKYSPGMPDACCLATVSQDSGVSARNVVLREFDNDGFVFVTDSRSRKVQDLNSGQSAAMCYLWCYVNGEDQRIARQVRVEGPVRKLESDQFRHLYDREPLYCKVRAHLCEQDKPVEWDQLKQRHDEILDQYRRNLNPLSMPDHFVGYKLLPTTMEFYFARDHLIADRIVYKRATVADSWEHQRVAA